MLILQRCRTELMGKGILHHGLSTGDPGATMRRGLLLQSAVHLVIRLYPTNAQQHGSRVDLVTETKKQL